MIVPNARERPTRDSERPWLLSARGIRFAYPNGLLALDGMDLDVRAGEIVSLVGPSGCGKSTLLSIIAGLTPPTAGSITWNKSLVEQEAIKGRPRRKLLTLVFQRDTLLPWRTAEQNVAFGLRYVSMPEAERIDWLNSLFAMARLEQYRKAYPRELSGGMRRRVALLMGVAPLPRLLLLDEPFAALDEPTRVDVHTDLLKIIYELGLSVILVTHDLAEAISLSDTIFVLTSQPGRIAWTTPVNLGESRDVLAVRSTEAYAALYADTWRELWRAIRGASSESRPVDHSSRV